MNTNRRQRGEGGRRICVCPCVCVWMCVYCCKQGEREQRWRQRKWGQIRKAKGERTDKAEWKMRESEGKRTTTWFHPLLSHSWQRLALVTDRQITLLWLIKPGYRWRKREGKKRERGNEEGRGKEVDHKNRQGKKRVKKRQRGIWGGRRDCGRMEGTKDPGWDEAMEKKEGRGKKGMSELFSNILLSHLKLKKMSDHFL